MSKTTVAADASQGQKETILSAMSTHQQFCVCVGGGEVCVFTCVSFHRNEDFLV